MRSLCVMALVALCAGLAHSFSWDIVVGVRNLLVFIDNKGTITHTEKALNHTISHTTYDPVHNRVLLTDYHYLYSFDIAAYKTERLMRITNTARHIDSLAYDPATELLFWIENSEVMYSISLKPKKKIKNSKVIQNHLILKKTKISNIAVDSCGGFIYWRENSGVHRSRFNGSKGKVVMDNIKYRHTLTIDQHSQKIYFNDFTGSIKSADLNGKNIDTIRQRLQAMRYMTVSKDFIYCAHRSVKKVIENHGLSILQIPKNSPRDMKPTIFKQFDNMHSMTANYNIEDIIQENQNCDRLKSLVPNNSDSDVYLKISVCHNYCLHGDCSASAKGQPKCSCNPGYSGKRCEVDVCQGYCLNGICSLSEEDKPLCKCMRRPTIYEQKGYGGEPERCC